MNRREFLFTAAAASAVPALASAASTPAPTPATAAKSGPLVRTPVSLMAPRVDGFEAVWGVNELCLGRIEYEDAAGRRHVAAANSFGFTPQHDSVLRVRVDRLQPGQSYRVRAITVSGEDGRTETSAWKTFRTLDASAATTHFVAWNDTHIHNDTIQRLDDLTPAADFLLWNGDTCNNWTASDLLVPTLLHPGGRDITARRPLLFNWGNHDSRGKFGYLTASIVPTPAGRPFCAFRTGPVACIMLHSGEDKPDNHPTFKGRAAFETLLAEEAEWLRAAIRQPGIADAPYRVVCCHMPLRWIEEVPADYANKGYDHFCARGRPLWHDSLVAWKTQLVISGHTHRSEAIPATPDFPYAQLTGGGPNLEQATWIDVDANAARLRVVAHRVAGGIAHELTFPPL
ncbi:metallophosphoesterase [Opitutus sp. ER46]|uniref:metallophosphoesterase family protein n=1 Tax=Opitutus sp. ER46 TaxID=2161864 RepID=UPI000D30EB07|nr:metallophosphoesterase [Opitutus sp. ER46]PTX97952.1 hypothetical protein DB354_06665 [Opitutus sp. ER46]